jgi:CheY-like chemotaxis protein
MVANTSQTMAQPVRDEQASDTRPLRVLLVDDNRDTAVLLHVLMTSWGHTARVAHDGEQALDMARAFKPEVVLLDVGLPTMHGFEVAQRLRKLPSCQDCLLIAVTGWGQEADRAQSKAAGINHHLVKPVEPETLRALLATYTPSIR